VFRPGRSGIRSSIRNMRILGGDRTTAFFGPRSRLRVENMDHPQRWRMGGVPH